MLQHTCVGGRTQLLVRAASHPTMVWMQQRRGALRRVHSRHAVIVLGYLLGCLV